MAKKTGITIDDKAFQKSMDDLNKSLGSNQMKILEQMADTLLALSRLEVPHDTGQLQASGHIFAEADGWAVAYNKVYASYVHEGMRADGTHVIQNYQKGRKKKFLEDPLKLNMAKWESIASEMLADLLGY